MRHEFLDSTSSIDSPIHRLDSRAKILGMLAAVVVCVSTPPTYWVAFAVYYALAATLLFLARLPLAFVARRLAMVLPFVVLVAAFVPFLRPNAVSGGYSLGIGGLAVSRGGLIVVWNTAAKAFFGVTMIVLLTGTTPFPTLLQGLRRLHCPEIIVLLLSFTYRYLFVLVDEVMRLRMARDARGYRGRWIWQAKAVGTLIAALFLRTYERAERIYVAMVSRGYDGRFPYLPRTPLRPRDALAAGLFLACMLVARVALPAAWSRP